MTASALVKESDLRRMAKIAKEGGVRVEIEINGKIIRVSPDIHTTRPQDIEPVDDDEDFTL